MHRTQLYLDDDQYRWLKRRAGRRGSIAQVVRDLIEAARVEAPDPRADPLLGYLLDQPPAKARRRTSATTIDEDVYGA